MTGLEVFAAVAITLIALGALISPDRETREFAWTIAAVAAFWILLLT